MKRNRICWAAWLLFAAGLYFFENNAGTRIVLSASILVPLFSAACAAVCGSGIRFTIDVPEKIVSGRTVKGCCISRSAALSAGCVIRSNLRVTNCLTGGSSLVGLNFEGDAPGSFMLSCEQCGCLTLSLEDTFASDWFGIWSIPVTDRAAAEVMVYPDTYPVRIIDPEDPSAHSGDAYEQQRRLEADPPAYGDVREYVPGDPIRRIHWKLSEKTDRLLIREDVLSEKKRIRLILSLGGKETDADRIAEAAEAFLSVSRSLLAEGYSHEAFWPDCFSAAPVSAGVGSEQEFLSVQEAVLCIRRSELLEGQSDLVESLPGDRVLWFDAAAERFCCTRDEPVLEL